LRVCKSNVPMVIGKRVEELKAGLEFLLVKAAGTMPRARSRPASYGASPPCWSSADLLLLSGPRKRRSALPTLAELQLMRKFRMPALFRSILETGSDYPELVQIMNTRLICQPRRNAPPPRRNAPQRGICASVGVCFGARCAHWRLWRKTATLDVRL
jgi:hypothetical protein